MSGAIDSDSILHLPAKAPLLPVSWRGTELAISEKFRRIAGVAALGTILAACAASGASVEPSVAPLPSDPSASESPTLAADARDAVCEAFRIVEEEISPTYGQGFETEDQEEVGAVVSAGGVAIAALASGVRDPTVAEQITALGEAYEREGEQVAAGEHPDLAAADLLTDMVVAHGDQCPLP